MWPCYWLEPTGEVALGLRRYAYHGGDGTHVWDCSSGNHDAFTWRGITAPAMRRRTPDGREHMAAAAEVPHDDPAWPAACERGCGYVFTDADRWQEWEESLYRRVAGHGGLYILHSSIGAPPGAEPAGPGAMWDAWWLHDSDWKGPDGISLLVRCPRPDGTPGTPHDWIADGPATGGGRWTRTGDPRQPATLTITPSIACGHPGTPGYYHGFLRAGVLTDHAG